MKKLLFTLSLTAFMVSDYASAQAFNSGGSYASVGYGLGIGARASTSVYSAANGYKFSGFGPASLNYEYGINDNIGLGVNLSYSSYGATWNAGTYDYGYRYSTLGIMARAAYHFDIRNRDLDLYSGVGLGFLRYKYNWTSDEPSFNESQYNVNLGTPLGYQIFAGGRYFFSDLVGAYAEVGYGITVLNAGIVLRF